MEAVRPPFLRILQKLGSVFHCSVQRVVTFEPALKSIEWLVKRIAAGETLFFVGAGFSLESEPNTSMRLIRRLVARFAGITETLATPRKRRPRGNCGTASG